MLLLSHNKVHKTQAFNHEMCLKLGFTIKKESKKYEMDLFSIGHSF